MKETMIVGFSGGRTSAFMCKWLIDNLSHLYDFIFLFANTGKEDEKTLEFVDRCDREWDLGLVWIEAVFHKGRKGSTHKIVSFKSATRTRALFEEMIKKYGIPNKAYPHCNRELKINPIQSWRRENKKTKCKYAIGMRLDEIDRMSDKAGSRNIIYPLISIKPTMRPEILHWWSQYSFDLEVPEHYGNCVTCWKKSARKQLTLAKNDPKLFDDFDYLEKNYAFSGSGSKQRQFNSGVRFGQEKISIEEIVHKGQNDKFIEFKEIKPEYQLDLIGFDAPDGCSESCEAFL